LPNIKQIYGVLADEKQRLERLSNHQDEVGPVFTFENYRYDILKHAAESFGTLGGVKPRAMPRN